MRPAEPQCPVQGLPDALPAGQSGAIGQLQSAARLLSGMLAAAVAQTAEQQAAAPPPTTRELKELTGILKDITGVVKTLEPPAEEDERTGVVILPEAEVCGPE